MFLTRPQRDFFRPSTWPHPTQISLRTGLDKHVREISEVLPTENVTAKRGQFSHNIGGFSVRSFTLRTLCQCSHISAWPLTFYTILNLELLSPSPDPTSACMALTLTSTPWWTCPLWSPCDPKHVGELHSLPSCMKQNWSILCWLNDGIDSWTASSLKPWLIYLFWCFHMFLIFYINVYEYEYRYIYKADFIQTSCLSQNVPPMLWKVCVFWKVKVNFWLNWEARVLNWFWGLLFGTVQSFLAPCEVAIYVHQSIMI